MAILDIIKEPDPLLRRKSSKNEFVDKYIKDLMSSMFETMKHENGIGIAAIQMGVPVKALIVDFSGEGSKRYFSSKEEIEEFKNLGKLKPFFIINPEIVQVSKEKIILSEGCLSVRDQNEGISFIRGDVERPISIAINYLDLDGAKQYLEIDGTKSEYDKWFARCLQHEIDHLEGILFIDRLYLPIIAPEENIEILGNPYLD